MDGDVTKQETSHSGEDTQRARRVMFADEVGVQGRSHHNHPSKDGDGSGRQQHPAAAADGPPLAEEDVRHSANEHTGPGGRSNRRQRRRGGPAKVAAVIAEALVFDEDTEEDAKQRLDDHALLLSADENTERLQLEVMELQEQDEICKAHRALRGQQLHRNGNPGARSGGSHHCEGAADMAPVGNIPVAETKPPAAPPVEPPRGGDAKVSKGPLAVNGFTAWATSLLAAFYAAGAVWRRQAWRLLLALLVLLLCRRLLLRASPPP
ncbi:hypothetical protein TraAM80_01298 [Trypanosoma rangeli]|uniref:Uncharacterized protein n=1 Tax=Trypanosoma rangeli TaxID=5698 RepID=A0A422NZ34_TRYRA|nr:uncharacterized protein TraAM80_01298 [Trypanosoma rangeli]RNF10737.1 hypothetical protein TraAM80_01298 [Trypanosoma rangeli]|eukprot:RNF10737.1 hypothetical protein TraAM80_01298 [Trypanosoma rangeli]